MCTPPVYQRAHFLQALIIMLFCLIIICYPRVIDMYFPIMCSITFILLLLECTLHIMGSIEFASMELSDRIYNYLGNCQIPFAVFLDLSNAFDTLDHNILLQKLDHYGIRGVAKQLFESYITNRQQFVQNNDIRSKVITTNIGVPQGSVLGPI